MSARVVPDGTTPAWTVLFTRALFTRALHEQAHGAGRRDLPRNESSFG
ncbi:MAG TPA: hypothetical protein VJ672_14875 [Gemmatimonadaceae bacterium]|nr:hypothetical protein [Gemmatimonadaceae bacterium]